MHSISKIYDKARRNKSFAALLQLYLKIKWKYRSRIDGDFAGKSLSALRQTFPNLEHKEYSSILKLEKIKEAIRKWKLRVGRYKVTYKKLLDWKKRWIQNVKMRYSGVRYDIVKISDAIKLYKDMVKAWEISIRTDEAWVKYAKHHKYNYKAAQKELEKYWHKENHNKWRLEDVVYWAKKYLYDYHASEHKMWFVKKMKKLFGYDIRRWKKAPWCDMFVELILNISWVAKRYHLHWIKRKINWEKYILNMKWLTAAWALWYPIGWAHIWISMWDGTAIYGNDSYTVDRVARHTISRTRFYGWVYPWDYGKKNKVHWAKNMWRNEVPPVWAIIVQKQAKWGWEVERKLRKIAGYWWKGRVSSYYRKNRVNTYHRRIAKSSHPNPLDALKTRY